MLDLIMSLFGYENVSNIKIPKEFKSPRGDKMVCKLKFYLATGSFIDKIIINNENELLDGYTTLKLCKWLERKYVKVTKIDVSIERYLNEFKIYRVQLKYINKNQEKRRNKYK